LSRQKASQLQLDAFKELKDLESVSQIEYALAKESNEQAKALVQQVRGRVSYCKVMAPFDGRVSNKMASAYEYVQPGRALMDIASNDPLRAQFLIPSRWLRWLNVGTPLSIYLKEVGREY